jgi:hypothetical protein
VLACVQSLLHGCRKGSWSSEPSAQRRSVWTSNSVVDMLLPPDGTMMFDALCCWRDMYCSAILVSPVKAATLHLCLERRSHIRKVRGLLRPKRPRDFLIRLPQQRGVEIASLRRFQCCFRRALRFTYRVSHTHCNPADIVNVPSEAFGCVSDARSRAC